MRKKLIVLCGQTATGKTSLGITLAKKLNGEIVSADSRQVYKGLDIGTGKIEYGKTYAIQKSRLGYLYMTDNMVPIWCYDLAEPTDDFNVSSYMKVSKKVILDIWARSKLPIIVGGSGLYIRSLIDGLETAGVAPDIKLREKFKGQSAKSLYDTLFSLDRTKAEQMNSSDRYNPRRLLRAIEIAKKASSPKNRTPGIRRDIWSENRIMLNYDKGINFDSLLMLGLTSGNADNVDKRIKKRVFERLEMGFEDEVYSLLERGIDWRYSCMLSTGYRQYKDYYLSKISKEEFVREWITAEKRYAKRQMTWFKKDRRIKWIDTSNSDLTQMVEMLAENWYHECGRKCDMKEGL